MSNPLNLVGNKYGKLTVIKRSENNNRGNTQWLCQCECGNTKIALGYDLTHGRTTSCGCQKYETKEIPEPKDDLTGKRFGHLTVVRIDKNKGKYGAIRWLCQCDCGNTLIALGSNLKTGHSTSCGKGSCRKPRNFKDLTGQKFGKLTVIRKSDVRINNRLSWLCQCDCGNTKVVDATKLRTGKTKSCGCLTNNKPFNDMSKGESKTNLYKKWLAMRKRCKPTYHAHKDYYDRGIKVCDEWDKSYNEFKKWALANGYSDTLTLDRIDVNGIYEPTNCRWITNKKQQNNKRNNVYISYNGKNQTLKEWSEELGLTYGMLKVRHQKGEKPPELFRPKEWSKK